MVVLCIVFQFECLSPQFLCIILCLVISLAVRYHCYLFAVYCFYLYLLLLCAVVFLRVAKQPNSQSANTLFLMSSAQGALLARQAWISEWSFNLCKYLSFFARAEEPGRWHFKNTEVVTRIILPWKPDDAGLLCLNVKWLIIMVSICSSRDDYRGSAWK